MKVAKFKECIKILQPHTNALCEGLLRNTVVKIVHNRKKRDEITSRLQYFVAKLQMF